MGKDRKTITSVRSLIQFLKKVKIIYRKLNKNFDSKDISLLQNVDQISKLLKRSYKNPKDHYWSIINVLKTFPDTDNIVKKYSALMSDYIKKDKKIKKL